MLMQCSFCLLSFNELDCWVGCSTIIVFIDIIIVFIDIIIKIVPSVILLLVLIEMYFHHHIMKNNAGLDNCCYIFDVPLLYCLHKELKLPLKHSKGTFNIFARSFLPLGKVFVRLSERLTNCFHKSCQFQVDSVNKEPNL
jgi:hypothetical protein